MMPPGNEAGGEAIPVPACLAISLTLILSTGLGLAAWLESRLPTCKLQTAHRLSSPELFVLVVEWFTAFLPTTPLQQLRSLLQDSLTALQNPPFPLTSASWSSVSRRS